MKKVYKIFCHFKNTRYICTDLTMRRSIKVLLIAAFFISVHQDSIGCCFSLGSRYISTIDLRKSEINSLFLFNNIISPTMRRSTKNESKANNSNPISRTAHDTRKTFFISLTGVKNNQCKYALRKAIYEFLVELTQGHIFSELRFVKKFEAICLLYPEQMKDLRGQTVLIR